MTRTTGYSARMGNALDAGLALFSGGAAAFFAFAMPQPLFETLVVKSGLPRLAAAAQPPLGADMRWSAVAAAGLLTAALVWSLMKALDRRPATAVAAPDETRQEPVIRLRKADAHPDAPARAPLLAGRDLGEPFELDDVFDAPETAGKDDVFGGEPEAEPYVEPEPQLMPAFLVPQAPEPVAALEPESEPEPEPEPLSQPVFELRRPRIEIQPEIEPEPRYEAEARPAAAFEPETEDAAESDASADSISSLMQRFESGLSRKQQAIRRDAAPQPEAYLAPAAPAAVAPEPPTLSPTAATLAAPPAEPVLDDRVGHRLRSAIAGLQKTAAGG